MRGGEVDSVTRVLDRTYDPGRFGQYVSLDYDNDNDNDNDSECDAKDVTIELLGVFVAGSFGALR